MEAHMKNPSVQAGASRNQLGRWLHSFFYQTKLASANPPCLALSFVIHSARYGRTLFAGVLFR
jgi:hypothetical protein